MRYEASRHTLVFVGGLHRSGTTVLADLIAAHPDATGFSDTGVPADEGQHLQGVYPTARTYGGPGRFGFSPESHLTEESPLVSEGSAAALLDSWEPWWDMGRRVLVEKSPPNLVRTRFLQALFPEARFVVITRHPAAVSLATRKWSKTPLSSLLSHWAVCHDTFASDRPHLRHVLAVSYEELIRSPADCLARVHEFLGLASSMPGHSLRPEGNDAYFARWRGMRVRSRLLAARFESRVARHGYSLRDLDRFPAAPGGGALSPRC